MIYDEEGFIYPKWDANSCKQCGRCNEVCPAVSGSLFIDKRIVKILRGGGKPVTSKQYMLLIYNLRRSIYASCTN